uniref:Uncharacterized protein n=1 Tax=Acrobeloides nanus TaxID=290746 RepID=A0A914CH06_9BILA
MDDKRLIIYRTEGETFLHFNQTQIRNSIFRIHFAEEHEEKQDKAMLTAKKEMDKKFAHLCVTISNQNMALTGIVFSV